MAARKSKGKKPATRKVRTLRHWRQQFDPNASFIARKVLNFSQGTFEPGDVLSDDVVDALGRTKLKRLWQANRIELAEFEPTEAYGVGTPLIDDTARAIAESKAEQDALMAELADEAITEADGPGPTGEE